ncbi:hypothetical protein KVV02_001132 [Mortierella alpina]|uniref:Uncharacterized protein n=1 Tax=Mortierella alpina TaxID=64518 RepID=A0A9P8A6E2_MORAP|nr:hypothetical protein KVV02_001132 [Mortierella alpina]
MPDLTKDRPGEAPPFLNGYTTAAVGPDKKRIHHQHPLSSRADTSPLSLALPLSTRATSGLSLGHSSSLGYSNANTNGTPSAAAPSSLSAGYLEHRRDTFHSLTQLPSSSSSGSFQPLTNTNLSNNVSWPNHSPGLQHDDHAHGPTPAPSHPPLHHRPQSLSYANQQHTSVGSPVHPEATSTRRRRLSTASSSSKHRLGSSSNHRSKAPNTPHHTRRFTTLISDQEPDTTYLWGYLLFFCTMIGFTLSMYALVASNYVPKTENKTLDWIKQDSHYCMLVPVTIPVTVLAVLFNWLGMKLFRHN